MTDIVATVRDRLLSLNAITSLVSTRVWASHLPQSPVLPAVLVEFVDDVQASHLRGGETMRMTRVQVSSIATSRASAEAIVVALEGDNAGSALAHWSGVVGSPGVMVRWCEPAGGREVYDSKELRQFRVQRDFRVHHR